MCSQLTCYPINYEIPLRILFAKFKHALNGFYSTASHLGRNFNGGPLIAQCVVYFLKCAKTHKVAFVATASAIVGRNGNETLVGAVLLHFVQDAAFGDY
mgnify:CR=1 FL=1